jgi:hypothetical protein
MKMPFSFVLFAFPPLDVNVMNLERGANHVRKIENKIQI